MNLHSDDRPWRFAPRSERSAWVDLIGCGVLGIGCLIWFVIDPDPIILIVVAASVVGTGVGGHAVVWYRKRRATK